MSSFRRRGVAGPNCVSVSTLMQAPRCFDLAIMQRRRKLIDMHQDNLSSFRPRKGRGCSSPWPIVQGADRGCAGG
jgi:hypothetical protein